MSDSEGEAGRKEFFAVGERLHAVRLTSGLSQRELARRANITNGSLSMIEQGKVSPSISSLEKILSVIPMSLPEFFSDALSLSPPVYRKEDFLKVSKDGVNHAIMQLSELSRQEASLNKQSYAPGAEVGSDWMIKKGYIAGIVVEGAITLYLEGKQFELTVGDGFHFAVHRTHNFKSDNVVGAEVVVVSFPDSL